MIELKHGARSQAQTAHWSAGAISANSEITQGQTHRGAVGRGTPALGREHLQQAPGLIGRRSLLLGLGASLVAAPAIVRIASIMPVRALDITDPRQPIWLYGEPNRWMRFTFDSETGIWSVFDADDGSGRPGVSVNGRDVMFPEDWLRDVDEQLHLSVARAA
jgi:hypothetical protein